MNTSTQWLLLGGLILILGTLLFFEWIDESEPQRVPLVFTTGQTVRDQTKWRQPQTLSLSSLNASARPTTFTQPRNIFAPLFQAKPPTKRAVPKPLPKAPSVPLTPASSLLARPVVPSLGPSAEERAIQQAKAQLSQYRFLGYLTQGRDRQVFLSKGKAIYIAKQGETIEGDIEVRATDAMAVTLAKPVQGTEQTVEATLPLTKNQKNGA
ncbi:MAG: hypothetical protein GKS05_10370 [Nitrospirales bacterium]|nr:hypothetical protein [Nitrospirales bacterium]